ncbi:MAG: hypothetical protein ACLQJ0_28730 [Steroidobacteraceae bacterium]|jgi:hypothetical protein
MAEKPRRDKKTRVHEAHGKPELRPGEYFWGACAADRILVRLMFAPDRNIQVDLWWNTVIGAPVIRLCVGLYPDSVEFGELLGNGFNHPQFHQKGYGTLVVNTAIQSLQASCSPAMRIEGVLLNVEEEDLSAEERNRLAKYRHIFWSRFGLGFVTSGPQEETHLRGTVGALKTVRSGQIADQFPRFVPLASFARTRPQFV